MWGRSSSEESGVAKTRKRGRSWRKGRASIPTVLITEKLCKQSLKERTCGTTPSHDITEASERIMREKKGNTLEKSWGGRDLSQIPGREVVALLLDWENTKPQKNKQTTSTPPVNRYLILPRLRVLAKAKFYHRPWLSARRGIVGHSCQKENLRVSQNEVGQDGIFAPLRNKRKGQRNNVAGQSPLRDLE